jgi:hypothetical protein
MSNLFDRSQRIQEIIVGSIADFMDNSGRSMQAAKGILGPSDIGFCRQKAALMIKGVPQTDRPSKWAAAVGTSIHNYVEAAIKQSHPEWIVGSIDDLIVTATLPSGAQISGHPDIVVEASNAVLDIKTVDGFEYVKREGTSLQHKYQRHLYALGLVQEGVLTLDEPLIVGNIYFDRSGKQQEPLVYLEEFNHDLTAEIDSWIQDVIYAVHHDEIASRDVAAIVCERICSHFTACRGSLPINDGAMLIEDPQMLTAVDMYAEALEMSRQADRMKAEAKGFLYGVNGTTGKFDVRWIEVQGSGDKPSYLRFDLVKSRTDSALPPE